MKNNIILAAVFMTSSLIAMEALSLEQETKGELLRALARPETISFTPAYLAQLSEAMKAKGGNLGGIYQSAVQDKVTTLKLLDIEKKRAIAFDSISSIFGVIATGVFAVSTKYAVDVKEQHHMAPICFLISYFLARHTLSSIVDVYMNVKNNKEIGLGLQQLAVISSNKSLD